MTQLQAIAAARHLRIQVTIGPSRPWIPVQKATVREWSRLYGHRFTVRLCTGCKRAEVHPLSLADAGPRAATSERCRYCPRR